ncbi:carboxypeptidase regulatory-like domain-containing protein [Myxococcus landrumensis]|uniref:Carboxypeptidase regulatory-like domain-containing protein n=2 Tax=Myxococcus landrumensis TaxID=2813577 RepID=A0ABX7N6Q0_9BACT|nr:carboxypeptidase regulatory-like domain-containing protein [Myxococcus landrumus]
MHSRVHFMLGAALILCTGACGNLENAPLRVGTIQGQLTEFDPAVAMVALVGDPEVRTTVDATGRFKLEDVPTGAAELFIVATSEKAARVAVKVSGGKAVDVPRVEARNAGFFEMRVKATHGERVAGVQVFVRDTPFDRLILDGAGRLRVGPLPDGCYALTLTGAGFPLVTTEACVGAGEKKELKLELVPNSGIVNRCGLTGCADGLVCAPGGRCVECVQDGQCGEGMMCKGFRCGAAGPSCGACGNDGSCDKGSTCQPFSNGSSVCVKECTEAVNEDEQDFAANRCEAGFTCQKGRCLPDPSRFVGCDALERLGDECADDARCQKLGLAKGICVEGHCTVPCTEDLECPDVSHCQDTRFGRVCSVLTR